jgi:hypothetical protein
MIVNTTNNFSRSDYFITLDRPLTKNSTITTLFLVNASTSGGLSVPLSRASFTRTQLSSKPLSGTFRIECKLKTGIYNRTVDLLSNASLATIAAAIG